MSPYGREDGGYGSPTDALRRIAWCSLVLHALAGLTMLLALQRGLQTNDDLHDRLTWLDENRTLWQLAWLPWPLAAGSMLFLGRAFAHCIDELVGGTVAAVFGVAVALDLAAEALLMGVLPEAAAGAARSLDALHRFHLLERSAVMITGCAANGLYTVGATMMAWRMRRHVPAWSNAASMVVAVFGFGLSAAALVDSARGMYWTNMFLVPAILLWQLGITRSRPL